jgi:hypothetical protein
LNFGDSRKIYGKPYYFRKVAWLCDHFLNKLIHFYLDRSVTQTLQISHSCALGFGSSDGLVNSGGSRSFSFGFDLLFYAVNTPRLTIVIQPICSFNQLSRLPGQLILLKKDEKLLHISHSTQSMERLRCKLNFNHSSASLNQKSFLKNSILDNRIY